MDQKALSITMRSGRSMPRTSDAHIAFMAASTVVGPRSAVAYLFCQKVETEGVMPPGGVAAAGVTDTAAHRGRLSACRLRPGRRSRCPRLAGSPSRLRTQPGGRTRRSDLGLATHILQHLQAGDNSRTGGLLDFKLGRAYDILRSDRQQVVATAKSGVPVLRVRNFLENLGTAADRLDVAAVSSHVKSALFLVTLSAILRVRLYHRRQCCYRAALYPHFCRISYVRLCFSKYCKANSKNPAFSIRPRPALHGEHKISLVFPVV